MCLFLDDDAFDAAKMIYKELNHGRLYGKIKYIPVSEGLDPSKIFELEGRRGILTHLKNAVRLKEETL